MSDPAKARDENLAARLVGVPDRYRQRCAISAFDGNDTNVQIGQVSLTFRAGHLRHDPTNPVTPATIPDLWRGNEIGAGPPRRVPGSRQPANHLHQLIGRSSAPDHRSPRFVSR